MDPFCCDGICCALFAHLFIRNPYQLRFWSWCCRCIVTIWFDCPQVSWSARPTLIPRGGRSIPTAGIFLFNFWWPEINPWVHTFWKNERHGRLTHMRGYHVGLAVRTTRFDSQGGIIFFIQMVRYSVTLRVFQPLGWYAGYTWKKGMLSLGSLLDTKQKKQFDS